MTEADETLSDLAAVPETKPHSFAPDQLIDCEKCLRANPPTRTNCLYCGVELRLTKLAKELQGAKESGSEAIQTEIHGPGFFVVITPAHPNEVQTLSVEIAEVLQLQVNDVERFLMVNGPVPVMRSATAEEAGGLAGRLRKPGISVDVFPEDLLRLDQPTNRVRSLQLSENDLSATLTSGAQVSIAWNKLTLMVTGRLLISRTENQERKGRSGSQPVESRELFSDEPVMDLYTSADAVGLRISASSFDFSCLEDAKALTAFENFTTLVKLIRARAPRIEFDDSYFTLRSVLNNVWPLEPQTSRGDWRRRGIGKVDVSTITTVGNENQLNAYSRLRQQIKIPELESEI